MRKTAEETMIACLRRLANAPGREHREELIDRLEALQERVRAHGGDWWSLPAAVAARLRAERLELYGLVRDAVLGARKGER